MQRSDTSRYRISKKPRIEIIEQPASEHEAPPSTRRERRHAKWVAKGCPRPQVAQLKLKHSEDLKKMEQEKEAQLQRQRKEFRERERKSEREKEIELQKQVHALNQERKRLIREADAAKLRGLNCEKWANEMVHGEKGQVLETAMARAISLRATMEDRLVDSQSAVHAAVDMEMQAQTAVNKLPELSVGVNVWYLVKGEAGRMVPATVVHRECEGEGPVDYVIKFDNGNERSTVRGNLLVRK